MQLEMYLNGRIVESIAIGYSQLKKVHELQQQLEEKYDHELEHSDKEPRFFITGIPSGMDEQQKNELRQAFL